MKILIVDKQNLTVLNWYEADAPDQKRFGGSWGRPEETAHVVCSPSIDPDCAGVEDQSGVLVAVLDENKLEAKQAMLWETLRNLRDAKLASCDWTQITDAPLNTQDKAAWAAYRQELRDLPENTEDPAAPVWPDEPNVQI